MRSIAPLLVLLAAGLAVGIWLLDSNSNPGSTPPVPDVAGGVTPTPGESGSSELVELDDAGREGSPPRRATASTPETDDDPAASVVAATLPVSGRVVDALGRPVAGAEVSAGHGGDRDPWFYPGRQAPRPPVTTRSDARGEFTLAIEKGPPTFTLTVHARGYAPLRRTGEPLPDGGRSLGDITLDRGVILAGRVVDAGGAPVRGAEILRPFPPPADGFVIELPGLDGETVAVSDSDGRFEVASQEVGEWELIATHEAYPAQGLAGRTEHRGDHVTDLLVVLEDGLEIQGRLLGVPEEEQGLLEVSVRAAELDSPLADERRIAPVGVDGAFVVRGLRAERDYRLHARLAQREWPRSNGRSTPVTVPAGSRGVELVWSTGTTVTLRVADARRGEPLEEFQVESGLGWLTPLLDEQGLPRTHFPEGLVCLDGLWPREGRDELRIRIEAAGYEPLEHQVTLDDRQELDLGTFELQPMPMVRVTVRDRLSGEPIEGAGVTLRAAPQSNPGGVRRIGARLGGGGPEPGDFEDLDSPAQYGETDAAGLCVLSSLPGVRAVITVRAPGYAPTTGEPELLPLREDVERDFELSAGGTVLVTVVDGTGAPASGAKIEHQRPISSGEMLWPGAGSEPADSQGRARFAGLEPGLHAFRVEDRNPRSGGFVLAVAGSSPGGTRGEEWREVLIEGGEEHQLRLVAPPRGSLSGRVTEDGVPLANARLTLYEADDPEARFAAMLGGAPATHTDGSGRYLFEDLKLGRYAAEFTHASRAMAHEVEFKLEEGENELDVDLPVCIIEGKVTDEDGEPVEGATVTVARREIEQTRIRMVMVANLGDGDDETTTISAGDERPVVTTDARGRYSLRGVTPDVELFVEVRAEGYGPTTSEGQVLQPGERRDSVDVQLIRGGSIVVAVTTAGGEPAGGLLAVATYEGENETSVEPVARPVTAGEARFDDLMAGPWRVRLNPGPGESFDEAPPMPEPQSALVESGEQATLSFTLLE